MTKYKDEPNPPHASELYQLFSLITSSPLAEASKITLPFSLPKLTPHERDMIQMILWYELYTYLSHTLNIEFKEEDMFNNKMIRALLLQLIQSGENLEGIHYATRIPFDILHDITAELNTSPSINVSITIIGYFITVKRSEYTEFIRKILQCVAYQYS